MLPPCLLLSLPAGKSSGRCGAAGQVPPVPSALCFSLPRWMNTPKTLTTAASFLSCPMSSIQVRNAHSRRGVSREAAALLREARSLAEGFVLALSAVGLGGKHTSGKPRISSCPLSPLQLLSMDS